MSHTHGGVMVDVAVGDVVTVDIVNGAMVDGATDGSIEVVSSKLVTVQVTLCVVGVDDVEN